MRYETLGRSGLRVSEMCLGTMTFGMPGWGCDEETSLALVARYLEAGGNFLDTADIYSGGRSEEICAKALRGRRQEIVLATKCHMPTGRTANERASSRKHIREACEASLRRLGTDYIDLYQVHCEDPDTPLEETLTALDDLVQQGKVLYLGCSNYRAYRLAQAVTRSDATGKSRFISLQPQYNLLVRDIEREHFAACRDLGVGIITWSPLAAGMLSGKITRESRPEGSRLQQREMPLYGRYFTDRAFEVVEALRHGAERAGCTPAALALAWQRAKPEVTSIILGVRTQEQLDGNLAALDVELSEEILAELDVATALPATYPNEFIDWIRGQTAPREKKPKKGD